MFEFPDEDFPQLTHFGYSDDETRLPLHPHRHLGYEVVYFVRGSAKVGLIPGQGKIDVGPETVIITAPGTLHGFEFEGAGAAFYWLGFQTGPTIGRAASSTIGPRSLFPRASGETSLIEDTRFSLFPFLERIDVKDIRVLGALPEAGFLFRRMEEEMRSDLPYRRSVIHLAILELLTYIERHISMEGAATFYRDIIGRVRARMDMHCLEKVGLESLAEYAGLDPAYLCRAFRARYGLAPIAYARRARLEKAKQLLASGSKVGAVALQCGYSSIHRFSAAFLKATGSRPSRYAQGLNPHPATGGRKVGTGLP